MTIATIAVVGSRTWTDYDRIHQELARLWTGYLIISGGAKGADTLAIQAAKHCAFRTEVIWADWDRHGKRAGFIRNEEPVKRADAVIAFWDGESKGTRDTIIKALDAPHIVQMKVIKAKGLT